jgi:hypothetical protein
MESKDKITILLHEYDTLRDEVVQRWNAIQQQISIFVVILIGSLTILWSAGGKALEQRFLYTLLVLGFCFFGYALILNHRDIQKINRRLRELEADINGWGAAAEMGNLLEWCSDGILGQSESKALTSYFELSPYPINLTALLQMRALRRCQRFTCP